MRRTLIRFTTATRWRWGVSGTTTAGASAVLALSLMLALPAPGAAAVTAYVTAPAYATSAPTVTVIDIATNTVTATIPLPGSIRAFGVALSPDRARLYVTEPQDDLISVIDTTTNTVTTTFALSGAPTGLAFNPADGRFLYVAQLGDGSADGSVAVIDTTTNTLSATVALDTSCHAADVAITPNGRFAYVTGYCGSPNSGQTFVIDTATNTLVGPPIAVTPTPFGLAIAPNGRLVYVGSQVDLDVSVIDTATNTVIATVSNPSGGPLGQQPVVSPNGASVYVAGYVLAVISTATQAVTGSFDIFGGMTPSTLGLTPDGRFLYAASSLGPNTLVIDTATKSLVGTIAMPGGNRMVIADVPGAPPPPYTPTRTPLPTATPNPAAPGCAAVAPGEARSFAYVPNTRADQVSVIDTSDLSIVGTIPANQPYWIAVNPAGTRLYVSNASGNKVKVIDTATDREVSSVAVDAPQGMAVHPSGNPLYVTATISASWTEWIHGVYVIDTATNRVIGKFPIGAWVVSAAVSPDGTRLYLLDPSDSGSLVVVDTATYAGLAQTFFSFRRPSREGLSPDGGRAYVPHSLGGISVVDLTSNSVIKTAPQGGSDIAVSTAGRLYVRAGDTVEVLDAETLATITSIPIRGHVGGVALNASETRLFVTNNDPVLDDPTDSSGLSEVDTATNTVIRRILFPRWREPSGYLAKPGAWRIVVGPDFVCGNGIVEPCEECDDGNITSGDGCSATCTIESIAGGGARSTDCLSEWVVATAYTDARQRSNKQTCTDNDPSCDFDGGVVGGCTFHVSLCVNISDGRLPKCKPESLGSYQVRKPTLRRAARSTEVADVRAAVSNMAETMLAAPAGTCSSPADIRVPLRPWRSRWLRNRRTLMTQVKSVTGRRDTDTLTLTCLP